MELEWETIPGGYFDLNINHILPSDNTEGIPYILPTDEADVPNWLVPYRQRVRSDYPLDDGAVHFFLDDYRFRTTFTRPGKALQYLKQFKTILSPDFSIYRDMPRTMQRWNVYRNRWCGRYWQEEGFNVIPTVGWADSSTFEFCFLGLPERSPLAITTIGTHDNATKSMFLLGFHQMIKRLSPSVILCYGTPHPEMLNMGNTRVYPDYWDGLDTARKRTQTEVIDREVS